MSHNELGRVLQSLPPELPQLRLLTGESPGCPGQTAASHLTPPDLRPLTPEVRIVPRPPEVDGRRAEEEEEERRPSSGSATVTPPPLVGCV